MFTKLNKDQLQSKIDFINNYQKSINPATASIVDANANVENKNIATLESELNKDINIQINRAIIYNELKSMYDENIANKYIEMINNHLIYINDESSLKPYCVALSMYPFMLNGLKDLGGESEAPKHIDSFCGSFVNLIFAISSQFAGAVAAVEMLTNFDYFARKDYGENYLETHKSKIENHLQHIIYALNQPAAARGFQAVFFNISIFDKYYFNAIFEHYVYPDGTKPKWKSIDKLQKFFMKWFNEERKKAILTFPVVTFAGLSDGNSLKDKDYEDFISNELAEGNAFFLYIDKNASSLSSCCFSADQKCLTKSSNGINYLTFKELKKSKLNDTKRNFTIFHNGSWVKGKEIELPKRDMFEIITSNNKKIIVSDNHINPTFDGDKETINLTTDDYLMFNTSVLNSFSEKDEKLTYEQGFIVGAFLCNGYFENIHEKYNNTTFEIGFNMNIKTYKKMMNIIDSVSKSKSHLNEPYNNVYAVKVLDKSLVEFIQKWTNWKKGTKPYDKELNLNCLLQSIEFRKGILDGLYCNDDGNSNRCYTSSQKLAENIEVLLTSLGINSIIDIYDKPNENVIIQNKKYNINYPLYCVKYYNSQNQRSIKNVYKIKNNSIYFKIKSIKKIDYKEENIYCFEMDNKDEPYFTLPNGIITHNCRLRNDISDQLNEFSYTLGAGGVMTGSLNVITMNLNRIVQEAKKQNKDIFEYILYITKYVHMFQSAFRSYFKKLKSSKMLPVYDAKFITMDKQFLTVGINGLVESAEFLGYEISNNKEYKQYIKKVLKTISEENTKARKKYGFKFNTELIPAENLGVKNALWDKKDGYFSPRDCYNSYIYLPEDDKISIIDKIILHGKEFMQYLDGGSALHLNLENYLTKEGFKKLLNILVKEGCNYTCFNIKITICNDCNNIDKKTLTKCPKCGSNNIDYATRVIGYLKRISSFSNSRQKEEHLRYYNKTKIKE